MFKKYLVGVPAVRCRLITWSPFPNLYQTPSISRHCLMFKRSWNLMIFNWYCSRMSLLLTLMVLAQWCLTHSLFSSLHSLYLFRYDNMADLFSIINTLQCLEKAYIRDVVTPREWVWIVIPDKTFLLSNLKFLKFNFKPLR